MAFPSGFKEQEVRTVVAVHEGMTLRDYFAAKAIQALLVNGKVIDEHLYAADAYTIADAMLKARDASS